MVGLADVSHRRMGGFSLGVRQWLGIAVALLGDPPVLVFDEPINGLDPERSLWVRELLRSFADEGRRGGGGGDGEDHAEGHRPEDHHGNEEHCGEGEHDSER